MTSLCRSRHPDPLLRGSPSPPSTRRAKGATTVAVAAVGMRAMPAWFVKLVFLVTFCRYHVSMIASNVRGPAGDR